MTTSTKTLRFPMVLHTNGRGYWSRTAKAVHVSGMSLLTWMPEDGEDVSSMGEWGHLHVHFPKSTWDVDVHGLIYTDNLFLKELQDALIKAGVPASVFRGQFGYSEQGMQGETYVDFDIGPKLIAALRKLNKASPKGTTKRIKETFI